MLTTPLSPILILYLYIFQFLTLLYLLNTYKKSVFYVLLIFLFYSSIFFYLGKNITNSYRIITTIVTLWLSINSNIFSKFKKGDSLIIFAFTLFTTIYFYSVIINNDNWKIIFSQYSRYFIAFCLWFLVRKEIYKGRDEANRIMFFSFQIILFQIIVTLAKLIIFQGRQIEGIVGTLTDIGGSEGTIIPILGFIILWLYRKGQLSLKDWLFVVGLMSIGFMAGKRAVWFITPLVITAFIVYVPKLKIKKTMLVVFILAPIVFYFGVRLTPTLNPESKVWGSFDLAHVFEYSNKYQFGNENKKSGVSQGRGGATLLLFNKLSNDIPLSNEDWFGRGLSGMFATNYEEFDAKGFGISNKANTTGVFETYGTIGYIGVFTILFFIITLLIKIKFKRIRWVIMAIFAWEYFMYNGTILRTPAFMFLLIFIIHYSNFLVYKQKKSITIHD